MAVRIHVTAIRNCPPDDVRRTFERIIGSGFAEVPVHEHGGWTSFSTSVWGVGRGDLIKGLRELEKPGLQFTTSDASCWYATLCRPGEEPRTLVHHFAHHDAEDFDEEDFDPEEYEDEATDPELAFLEEDPPEPDQPPRPKSAFDVIAAEYADEGCPLPKELIEELGPLGLNQALDRFRVWHRDAFLGLLRDAGIPCDEAAVGRVIAWDGLSDREREADIGNLPRLMSVLGLGGEWDDWVQQAEAEPPEEDEEDEDDVPAEPPVLITPAERLLIGVIPASLRGGPVEWPAADFWRVRFFPEACHVEKEILTLLTVEFPPDAREARECQPVADPAARRVEWRGNALGYRFGFENHLLLGHDHFEEQLGEGYAGLLKQPPDGTVIQCSFAAEGEPATVQVYRGTVVGDKWRITATHPPLSAGILRDALEVMAEADAESHTLRDEAEADAVMDGVKRDGYLHGMGVRRDGLTVSCEYDVQFLVQVIFRQRYRDHWDVRAHEDHAERQYQQRSTQESQMRKSVVESARANMAPRLGDPLVEGKGGQVWLSSLNHFANLDAEQVRAFEEGMAKLGFEFLADITHKKFRDHVLHCYVSADRLCYSALTATTWGIFCWEFISRFEDGSNLTTTTSTMGVSRPAVKQYYKECPGMGIEELFEKHQWAIGRFLSHKAVRPVELETSPWGVAEHLDAAIKLAEQDEANSEEEDWDDDEE